MAAQLVTILMPTLNQAGFIEAAVASVLGQSWRNLELVVMDGGSSDNTLALLESLASHDTRLRYYSRPDNGPAQALNRALAQARGTIIGWLNSDDLYTHEAVARAVAFLQATPDALMVYGEGEHIDREGRLLEPYPTLPASTPVGTFNKGCFICQPTVFFRRTMSLLLGPYIDQVQAQSRLYDGTITMQQRRQVALEGVQVLHRHLGAAPKEWLLTYVDEVLADPAMQAAIDDLPGHFAEFLQAAAHWVEPAEIRLAEGEMRKRLHTHGS
jgi:glycosyltransferase involved in cell wall biosynthesis